MPGIWFQEFSAMIHKRTSFTMLPSRQLRRSIGNSCVIGKELSHRDGLAMVNGVAGELGFNTCLGLAASKQSLGNLLPDADTPGKATADFRR